jgi:sigma-E factor negative regulatory protein RseA
MKARISALMDGELERAEADRALDELRNDGVALDTWRSYHLISDAMQESRGLSAGFAARLAARLAAEPTVLAPRPRPLLEQRRWQVLSVAASLAAVAFVLTIAYSGREEVAPAQVAQQDAALKPSTQVAPPEEASDYVLAHQGYSPRNSLQGMAPYVRTVSSEVRAARR